MKFTGLIVICAAGSLALILPAAGVVKFPMRTGPAHSTAVQNPGAVQNSGFAVSASLPGGQPPSSSLLALTQPSGAKPDGTPIDAASLAPPSVGSSEGSSEGPIDPWNKQSLCMGFWVLLGPVALLGLALWTFSPGPKVRPD